MQFGNHSMFVTKNVTTCITPSGCSELMLQVYMYAWNYVSNLSWLYIMCQWTVCCLHSLSCTHVTLHTLPMSLSPPHPAGPAKTVAFDRYTYLYLGDLCCSHWWHCTEESTSPLWGRWEWLKGWGHPADTIAWIVVWVGIRIISIESRYSWPAKYVQLFVSLPSPPVILASPTVSINSFKLYNQFFTMIKDLNTHHKHHLTRSNPVASSEVVKPPNFTLQSHYIHTYSLW